MFASISFFWTNRSAADKKGPQILVGETENLAIIGRFTRADSIFSTRNFVKVIEKHGSQAETLATHGQHAVNAQVQLRRSINEMDTSTEMRGGCIHAPLFDNPSSGKGCLGELKLNTSPPFCRFEWLVGDVTVDGSEILYYHSLKLAFSPLKMGRISL